MESFLPYFQLPISYLVVTRKSRNSLFDLPPLELECMKALWALGEATVEDIRAGLMPRRPLAYTTVLTVMDRLARKGVVERRKQGRAHVYTSAVEEESIRERAVDRLVENFFAGSREDLRAHLSGAAPRAPKPPVRETGPKPRPAPRPTRKRRPPAPVTREIDPSLL